MTTVDDGSARTTFDLVPERGPVEPVEPAPAPELQGDSEREREHRGPVRARRWRPKSLVALRSWLVAARADPLSACPAMAVTVAVLTYVRYVGGLTVRNHEGFGTFGFDYGIYDQGVWLMSRLKAPFITIMGRNLFGDHTSFVLLPLVPIYRLWPDGRVLLWAQAAAMALGAVPIYLIARRVLGRPWLAVAFAFAFLANPSLAWTNVEQFHPDVFAVPLIGFAFWAMLSERWRAFVIFAVAATMVKEDIALVVVPLGVYCAVKHNKRAGTRVALWSFVWSIFGVLVVLKTLNSVGSLNGWRIPFGGPSGFARTTLHHPGRVYDYLVRGIDYQGERPDGERLWYGWQVVAPVLGLALLAPSVAVLGIFAFGSNVVSTFWYQYHIQYHYTGVLVPIVVIAAVFGVARFTRRRARTLLTTGVLLSSIWTGYLWGPMPIGRCPTIFAAPSAPWVAPAKQILADIPDDAVVSAYYGYVPHLGHRKEIYQFPVPWRDVYYGLRDDETAKVRRLVPRVEYVALPGPMGPESADVMAEIGEDFEIVSQAGEATLWKRRPGSERRRLPAAPPAVTTTTAPPILLPVPVATSPPQVIPTLAPRVDAAAAPLTVPVSVDAAPVIEVPDDVATNTTGPPADTTATTPAAPTATTTADVGSTNTTQLTNQFCR